MDSLETLTTRVQVQAIVYGICTETATEYIDLNVARFTGLVSRNHYHDILWEITANVTDNESQWQKYQEFSQLVTTLVNEYYFSFIEE
ncbi:MAG: hypothetical protein AAGF26_05840 [Cyanobacteria bacterium P01_G01_bin.49]